MEITQQQDRDDVHTREAEQQQADTMHNEDRAGTTADDLAVSFRNHMIHTVGRPLEFSSELEQYHALAAVVRDRVMDQWLETIEHYRKNDVRVVSYLSAEFLLGPHLENDLLNLQLTKHAEEALKSLGLDLKKIAEQEPEPGLGNGGLGRLAACFLDSLSTLDIPVIGYGLRYEFGIFRQEIVNGWQVEKSDKWLQYGNPWEIANTASVEVGFFGYTETYNDEQGRQRRRWVPGQMVRGVPYDTPIPGYNTRTVNRLRLWKSEAVDSFDLSVFNTGDYAGAVRAKMESETISKVLYPPDEKIEGKRLRLMQQFFFTSCSLQDMVRLHLSLGKPLTEFDKKWTVQLNDTHPSIGIAELMRLLMDVHGLGWDEAWRVTQNTFGYTNHTLLPEALERWPLDMFGNLLPRHLEIIFEINRRFLDRKHMNVGWVAYKTPFGHGRKFLSSGIVGSIVGGWDLNSIVTYYSGKPFQITDGAQAGNGDTSVPNLVSKPTISGIRYVGAATNPYYIVNNGNYVHATPGTNGNVGRNTVRGPGYFNLDVGLTRKIPIYKEYAIVLKAESFDVTNTPQFNNPAVTDINNLNGFGQITGVLSTSNRTLRFSGRISF